MIGMIFIKPLSGKRKKLPPLKHKKEFIAKSVSENPLKKTGFSLSAKEETGYIFHIFQIFFLVPFDSISFLWENDELINRWFSEIELRTGTGKLGEAITRFPVPEIIDFLSGGLGKLPDSFPKDV